MWRFRGYPDGLFVNAEIIRQGYGRDYPKYKCKYTAEFGQLKLFAQRAKKGLWGLSKADTAVAVPEICSGIKVKPIVIPPNPKTTYEPRTTPQPSSEDITL